MFKRAFKVVLRPTKNNFVLLPESYYKVVSTYDNGCLQLQYDGRTHYVSWAPESSKDNEIAINARVAKEIGLNENDYVKCTLVVDVPVLRNVFLTPVSGKDWEIIELSSEHISDSVLDQTRIVNSNQILIVWINKSIQVALTVDRLKPNLTYGRIDHTTQLIISPDVANSNFNGASDSISRSKTTSSITNGDEREQFKQQLSKSSTNKQIKDTQNVAKSSRHEKMERLKKDLSREACKFAEFRVISGSWAKDSQISDVFVNSASWPPTMDEMSIYCLRTMEDREYYVRVRLVSPSDWLPTIHPTVEMSANLMKLLQLKELEKVVLKPKPMVVNFVEKIELFANKKTHYKVVENAFKRFVREKTDKSPLLLNQNEIVRLEEDLIVTVGILPEHFHYCAVDSQFLKESKIYAADVVRNVDDIISVSPPAASPLFSKDIIKLRDFDLKVEDLISELRSSLCLDSRNSVLRQANVLLTGPSGAGKTVLVERILNELVRKPYFCHFEIFNCTRNKGRKAESVQKDLRTIFTTCLQNAPSIVVLENLDVLAHASNDQATQDSEYFNRIADVVHQLVVQYTTYHPIAVIATANEVHSLNKRLHSPRGRHLFQTIVKLPGLERNDREVVLKELCSHIESDQLDFERYALLTEGYNKGDLVQFIERAIFYAYRLSKSRPVLLNEHLKKSLENTNSYCLKGIENHQSIDQNSDVNDASDENKVHGLDSVTSVLEEVLMWPSRYPKIFNMSPLRNQAGVLLYGPPGTGKTFLVSKLAKKWNLRTISVKGPELLAKYIGQSEENVRNLFNRARSAKPCVLFFDEFDSLAPKRGHDSTGVTDRVVNQLLTELDGVEGLQGVTVIAATSRPELLDPALLRSGRIDRLVECPLPDISARISIFESLSTTLCLDETVDFAYFAERTENYTGADIQSVLTSANMIAVKEAIDNFGREKIPEKIIIKQTHLLDAFNSTRPSLSKSDVERYQKTYARFTNKEKSSRDYVSKRATLA
ncbi:peroxisomal biogenesis factor 1 [Musca autumnalis]|uniref:peroxisomal biogenesis factor 1 n=1 Tax=Musca autumnalis TaxID=221902 RepID=UPI003CED3D58